MNQPSIFSRQLKKAEKSARAGKLGKIVRTPLRYFLLMVFNKLVYPIVKRGIKLKTKTFFNASFITLLPAGTDISLHGIKAHDSEIRLTKFLCMHLKLGDTFIDIGAHYGYYSLLAASMVDEQGRVFAIEPTAESFGLLKENTEAVKTITFYQKAASDTPGEITFYEYPGPLAEYNTTLKDAYKDTRWIHKVKETVNRVETIVLDDLLTGEKIESAVIKIDAEGGELSVLKGLTKSLQNKDLVVIMEYLVSKDAQSTHHRAVELFAQYQYRPHFIQPDGTLMRLENIDDHLEKLHLQSDNLVFQRTA